LGTRAIQSLALLSVLLLLALAKFWSPRLDEELGLIAALGYLLLAGTLLSELLELLGLPHLSGYLLAGVIGGPYVLGHVDHHTVEILAPVNTLALTLIAIAGGVELRIATLKLVAKSVSWAMLLQSLIGLAFGVGAFIAFSSAIPFTSGLPLSGLFGVALMWAVLAISRSPSACLGILSQTRASGPLARFSLAFVMASDVVVVVLMAFALMLARLLITPDASLSLADFEVLGHELLGSIAMGTTLGLLLAAYLHLVGKHLLPILLGLGFTVTEFLRYVHIDPLLCFLTAGFVVENFTAQGAKLQHAVEHASGIVFVVFFATAGAHLDLPLLAQLWPVAIGLCFARGVGTYIAARSASRIAKDGPAVRRWGFSGLISQAGVTLGLAVVIARAFPQFGDELGSLVIATVAINEVVGPIMFKIALDRSGEAR
jgi:Kef-type K+ transport system membrane component KefB